MRSFRRGLGAAVLMVLVAAGAAGLLAARWTAPVAEGDAAVAARDWPRAYAAYGRAADRFDRLPAVRQFFARDYARAIAAQLWIDYNGERYDDVIERAQRAPDAASPHFWAAWLISRKAGARPKARPSWRCWAGPRRRCAAPSRPIRSTWIPRQLRTGQPAGRRPAQGTQGAAEPIDAAPAATTENQRETDAPRRVTP